jgi:hypothetical protein
MEQNTASVSEYAFEISNLLSNVSHSVKELMLAIIKEKKDVKAFKYRFDSIANSFKGLDLKLFDIDQLVNARFFGYNMTTRYDLKRKTYEYFEEKFGEDWQNKDVSHVEKSEKGIYVDPTTVKPDTKKPCLDDLHQTVKKAICVALSLGYDEFSLHKDAIGNWLTDTMKNFHGDLYKMDLSNIMDAEAFFNVVVLPKEKMKELELHFFRDFGVRWVQLRESRNYWKYPPIRRTSPRLRQSTTSTKLQSYPGCRSQRGSGSTFNRGDHSQHNGADATEASCTQNYPGCSRR